MLILQDAQGALPSLTPPAAQPAPTAAGAGAVAGAPGAGAWDGSLPRVGGGWQGGPAGVNAEVQRLERQLRAKDAQAQQLLGALSHGEAKAPKSRGALDIHTAMATGLNPTELAEAARIGLTPDDLEQLIEELAAKEFHQLEQMMEQIEVQGGSKEEAVDRWAKREAEKWVKEQFGVGGASPVDIPQQRPSPQAPSPQLSLTAAPPAPSLGSLESSGGFVLPPQGDFSPPQGEEEQVAALTLNAYTARRELAKMRSELARLKQKESGQAALLDDAVRLRAEAQAQVATGQSPEAGLSGATVVSHTSASALFVCCTVGDDRSCVCSCWSARLLAKTWSPSNSPLRSRPWRAGLVRQPTEPFCL